MDHDHFAMLAKRILRNGVVPFLGAGVNLCGRSADQGFREGQSLPSGSELARVLADEYGITEPEASLAKVSQHAVVVVGDGPLYDKLHEVFDHDYPPTAVHRFLAEIPAFSRKLGIPDHQLIISTNYDDALERAFADAGEPIDVVTYMERGKHAGRFVHVDPDGNEKAITRPNSYELTLQDRPVVLKIHGAIDRGEGANDSFVITEDDYLDYVIRAGSDLAKVFPVDLLSKARSSHFLFLGYSLRDWNLRVILNRIEAERAGTYESWSVQLDATELDKKAWRSRNVEVIPTPLEEYIAALRTELERQVAAEAG